MPAYQKSSVQHENQILSSLPECEYKFLLPHLKPVDLPQGKIIYLQDSAIQDVYFPTSGIVSLATSSSNGATVEVAMVGRYGIVGVSIILGVDTTPYLTEVQIAGEGMKMKANVLKSAFDRNEVLQERLLRYIYVLLAQTTQSATCNRFHTIVQRLCRWLLVARDEAESNELKFTQQYIAQMMGLCRPNVTVAARTLQDAGLIKYNRGHIFIIDRPGLESAACECYRVVKRRLNEFCL